MLYSSVTDVFISYSHTDAELIDPLVKLLRAVGADVFLDTDSIPLGKKWRFEITTAIKQATMIIVFWCCHSQASKEVEKEWQYAIEQGKDVLPVLLDETPVPSPLREFQRLDLTVMKHGTIEPDLKEKLRKNSDRMWSEFTATERKWVNQHIAELEARMQHELDRMFYELKELKARELNLIMKDLDSSEQSEMVEVRHRINSIERDIVQLLERGRDSRLKATHLLEWKTRAVYEAASRDSTASLMAPIIASEIIKRL